MIKWQGQVEFRALGISVRTVGLWNVWNFVPLVSVLGQ